MQHQDILTLVLCLCVPQYSGHTEWVEISQNGYRKGFTPHPHTTANTFLARPEYLPKTHTGFHQTANDHYDNVSLPFMTRKKPIIQRVNIGSIEKVELEPEEILLQKGRPVAVSVNANVLNSAKSSPSQSSEHDNEKTVIVLNNETFKAVQDDKPIIKLKNTELVKDESTPIQPTTTMKNIKTDNVSIDEQKNANVKVHNAKNEHLNNLGAVIKVLKLVQETISKNSHKTVKSKMRYLEDLKNSIMFSIEDRLEALWPTETGGAASEGRSRSSRSSKGDQVDFPSAESALMSISFLTFAVFLIKLVMQVIQAYKSKMMMVTPVFTTMGRAIFTHKYNKLKLPTL